ncbi:MAG: poly-gamma-glutamate hydrolase family protein [Asticcacaulis sp.]|uniref:poly-gamma-glutamate hydrolase family protein n=1 Tax=Asticcacaulis sp. TaxID=1872648 RepID=UPI0039E70861
MPNRFLSDTVVEYSRPLQGQADEVTTCTRTACLSFVIVAQYGGLEEPGTDICAQKIAGDTLSVHTLASRHNRTAAGSDLTGRPVHNRPEGIALVESCQTALTIRGRYTAQEMGSDISIDGLDKALASSVAHALCHAEFEVRILNLPSRAKHADNLCNRGLRGRGIELDLSHDLRERLMADPGLMGQFAAAVRSGLQSVLADC